VGRPTGVDRARLEKGADLVQWGGVVCVVLSVAGDIAARRGVEPEDQAHRRRLAGAVRADEAGDDAGPTVNVRSPTAVVSPYTAAVMAIAAVLLRSRDT
jgi:hypothetical protein